MEEPRPSQIGKYQLTDLLGQGAMGVVYRALDPVLNRYVAIKLMSEGIASDPQLRDRFMREAQSAGSLQHPNIITIFDFGETDGHLFIAMEYIDGADLSEIIERKDPLPVTAKLDIMIDVLHALNYAHTRKVVHRDIKPANIRVSTDGRAKLMDFGIARLEDSKLTQSGMLVGTPHYMAPEQVTSGQVSPATDIFSLGVVLYEFLTYRTAFMGDTLHAVLYKIVGENPPSLRDTPGVPDSVVKIVEKALAKDPQQRYAAAGAMAEALTNARTALSAGAPVTIHSRRTPLMTTADSLPRPGRLRRWIGVAAGAALLVGAAGWFVLSQRRAPNAPAAPALPASTSPAVTAPAASVPLPRTTPGSRAAKTAPPQPVARGEVAAASPPSVPATQAAPAATLPQPTTASSQAATPAQSSAQPSTPSTTPAATAPAPPAAPEPAADPSADIDRLIASYARAIESRSVAEIRRVYPGLTTAQQQNWEQFFQSTRNVRVRLAVSRLNAAGSSADLMVSGAYDFESGGRTENQPVSFRATAGFDSGVWRLQTVR
ncbi:MAG: serine/threonine-protein kinase [Gemmatimonadales bacterium]